MGQVLVQILHDIASVIADSEGHDASDIWDANT